MTAPAPAPAPAPGPAPRPQPAQAGPSGQVGPSAQAPEASSSRIVITPPGRLPLPRLGPLVEAREVLFRFAHRDITLRYRQTALGVVWVILQPLLGAGVLSFVFSGVAKLPTGGVPPLLYTFAGLVAWNAFNGVVSRGSTSLINNAGLLSKVYFPRVLIPLSTAGSTICDFVVSFGFVGVLLAVYGIAPGPAIVLAPLWLLLILCLAAGLALITSSLMVTFRDIGYVVPFVLQILLYASPVAYSTGAIPHKYEWFFQANPLTWLLNDVRWSLINQPRPGTTVLFLSVIVPIAVLLIGSLVFEKRERGFADVI